MKYVLIEGPPTPEVWVIPYDNVCAKARRPAYQLTQHFRDGRGDHFLSWRGDPPEGAVEFVVPMNRRLDAQLNGFPATNLRIRTTAQGEVIGFAGRPDHR